MYNIDKVIQSSTSTSSSISNTLLSTSSFQHHDDLQNQKLSTFHTPPIPSSLENLALASQYEHHHSYQYQSPSQTLSQDEWNLILSLRMIKNLSVSPPSQPSTSTVCRQTDNAASNQLCLSNRTGHQKQVSTCSTTSAQSIHSYTTSTIMPEQSLQGQQIQCSTIQMQQPLTTVAPSSPTISVQSGSEEISPQTSLSSQIQSGHQDYSFELQIQLHSPPPASPRADVVSPLQQHRQKSSHQSVAVSPERHQSIHPQTSNFYYDAMIVGPTVQLLDPTKPYKIGDAIKVGGRTLRSDMLSLKYWLEGDITVTDTMCGGHLLNMAGYSYIIKNRGKNFITWECQHRRRRRCSSILIRSSDPTVKHSFRIYSIQGEHDHEPASDNVEARKFKQRVKGRCRLELSSPRTIYEDELRRGKFSSKMLAILPTFYNMRK